MTPRSSLILLAAVLACGSALAQPAGAASAPGQGMGMGMGMGMKHGMGMGGMHGWHMTPDNTPGWSMMSRAERQAHHDKMMGMTDHAACSAYMEQHHAQMADRAKERGRTVPAMPRHDACAPLKKQ